MSLHVQSEHAGEEEVECWSQSCKAWFAASVAITVTYQTDAGVTRKSSSISTASENLRLRRRSDHQSVIVDFTFPDFLSPPLVNQNIRTSSTSCSIYSEVFPSQSGFRSLQPALNLSEFFKSQGQLGVPKGVKPVRTRELFEHEATGILCCAQINIFDVGQRTEDLMTVYHYTNDKGFNSILDSKELYASLLTKHGPRKDTGFGDGLYTTSKSPEEFGSKQAVLINNYSDADDPQIQKQDIASYEGSADYCVPLVVQRPLALDVVKYGVRDLGIKPGFNRHGGKVRVGRDIWVIKITDEEGHATNVHEPLDVLLDRVDRDDLRDRPDVLTSLGVHARRGNSAAARTLVDLVPHPSTAIQYLAKDEVRKLVSDAIKGDGSVKTPAWESVSNCVGAGRSHDVFLWAQLLEHPGWHVFDAIGALVKCAQPGDGQALKLLYKRFNDEDSHVRSSAVEAVGKVAKPGDGQALKLLYERFDDKDLTVRMLAVEAVGKVAQPGDGQALKLLYERFDDKYHVRSSAVEAVGKVAQPGDGQALKLLYERFDDKVFPVRMLAVEAVGKVAKPGDEQALKLLYERFNDEHSPVRRSAVEAVGKVEAMCLDMLSQHMKNVARSLDVGA